MGAREHYFDPSNILSLGFQTGLNLSLSVLMQDEKDEYGRIESILTDLMYLLRVPFEAENFDEEIRKRFTRGTEAFIHLISYMQVWLN